MAPPTLSAPRPRTSPLCSFILASEPLPSSLESLPGEVDGGAAIGDLHRAYRALFDLPSGHLAAQRLGAVRAAARLYDPAVPGSGEPLDLIFRGLSGNPRFRLSHPQRICLQVICSQPPGESGLQPPFDLYAPGNAPLLQLLGAIAALSPTARELERFAALQGAAAGFVDGDEGARRALDEAVAQLVGPGAPPLDDDHRRALRGLLFEEPAWAYLSPFPAGPQVW